MTLVAPGLYQNAHGFYVRPWIDGRRTWRKLKAVKLRAAIVEAAQGNFSTAAGSFAELAALYTAARCPNRKLQPREDAFTSAENARVTRLIRYFGAMPAASIRLFHLPKYHAWRTRGFTAENRPGNRTVDKDLATLSNVLNYAVAAGKLELNYIRAGRPRFQTESQIRHSRAVAPASADVIHQLAAYFLQTLRSEVFCWQAMFAQFTGCRTSELLRLRLDADHTDAPGYVDGNQLFLGRRSKRGVNPFVVIGPEFAAMFTAFRAWHADRFPRNPFYFPSHAGKVHVNAGAFGHALRRACEALRLPHITPHGFRSFYVTKRRSDGASDVQIAGEIGDKTVALMQTTYGDRPANWLGGKKLGWLPENSLPAWQSWLPVALSDKPASSVPVVYPVVFEHFGFSGILPQVIGKVVAGDGIEPPTQGFSVSLDPVSHSQLATIANVCTVNPTAEVRHSPTVSRASGISTGILEESP